MDRSRRRTRTRRIAGLAVFAIACAVSPSVRELVGGEAVTEPAAMSLLSFCLACIALALVIRSAIGDGGGRKGAAPVRTRAARRPLRQDLGRD